MACVVVAPRSGIAKDSAVRLSILRTMTIVHPHQREKELVVTYMQTFCFWDFTH